MLVLCLHFSGLLQSALADQQVRPSATLERVLNRGVVNIGVKTDFAPFGFLNSSGDPQGMEVDLAHDVARQLGVPVRIVSITTENRFQKLEQGDIDIMIATVADTRERRQIATAVEPSYYAGGVTVLMRPELHINTWQGLRGQKICATQGAYFNRPMAQRYLLDLAMYRTIRDALLALREGHCAGYLYSSAAVQDYLQRAEWAGYKAPLPIAMIAPWSIYISRREDASELDQRLGDIVAQWHRSAYLLERERFWGLQQSRFLLDEQTRWLHTEPDGRLNCIRNKQGQWPPNCRNPIFVRSDQAGGLLAVGLWIEEQTGMKLSFVYDDFDRASLLGGIGNTLMLTGGSVTLSLLLGVLWALLVDAKVPLLARLVKLFAVYGRMSPPLLQMYLLYFGLGAWLWSQYGLRLSAMLVAITCMSVYTGAAIMATLLDAAEHLREEGRAFRLRLGNVGHVVEITAGPVKLALTNVLKQSVMASAIAVPEILSAATSIMSDQGNVNVMMNVFLFTFILLITLWGKVFDRIEQLAHRHARGLHGNE